MSRIVVATNGSPGGRLAERTGLELARDVGADVIFVAVRDVSSMLREGRTNGDTLDALDDALAEAERHGLPAQVEIAEGDPVTEILRVAHDRDADLIVVGPPDPDGCAHGVALELPKHSWIPVLVVEERDEAAIGGQLVGSA